MSNEREAFEATLNSMIGSVLSVSGKEKIAETLREHAELIYQIGLSQASAQREGFVLVPVEPTQEMIEASIRRQWDELSSPMECMETLKYKAMIEAGAVR